MNSSQEDLSKSIPFVQVHPPTEFMQPQKLQKMGTNISKPKTRTERKEPVTLFKMISHNVSSADRDY